MRDARFFRCGIRRAAQSLGLHVAGSLSVLINSGWRGLVDFDDALNRLRQTSFHATDELFQMVRERYAAGPPALDLRGEP